MKTHTKKKLPAALIPAHPGEILLKEFLEPAGISQARLSQATGLIVSRVNDLVKGRRGITPDSAMRLGNAFGISPAFWLNLQADYDTRMAMLEHGREYAAIAKMPELAAAA